MLNIYEIKVVCKDGSRHFFYEKYLTEWDAHDAMMSRFPNFERITPRLLGRVH